MIIQKTPSFSGHLTTQSYSFDRNVNLNYYTTHKGTPMALFKVSASKEAVADSSGSSYINKSGIYDVTINYTSLDKSTKAGSQAQSVNFNFNYNGNNQVIYGPYITGADGSDLEVGQKLINKLAIIAGMGEGDDFVISTETHPVGKDNTPKDFEVIENFSDLAIKVRIQLEYSINPNTNEISERKVIKSFFREDGASAEEIINGTNIGDRLAWETANVADNVTYKDNLTAEDIAAWIEAKKSGKAAPAAAKPKVAPTAKTNGLFKK